MSGILRLESLTKGNTLKQGDKTPLKYRLFDADGEKLNIAGKSAKVRLVYPDFLTIGYEKGGLTVAQDDTVTFTIDNVIPSRIYHVEIIVDEKFIFPSRADESKFTVDKSSLGTETNIIEIVGVDAVVRKAVDLINVDPSLIIDEDKLVSDIINNTGIESIEEYHQQFNDVIKELSEEKDYHSLPEISGARGGHETLGARLDETTAQLAQNTRRTKSIFDIKTLGIVGDGSIDETEKLQEIVDYSRNENIKVINYDKNLVINISSPIYFDGGEDIDFGYANINKTTNTVGVGSNLSANPIGSDGNYVIDNYNVDAHFIFRHKDRGYTIDVKTVNIHFGTTAQNTHDFAIFVPRIGRWQIENITATNYRFDKFIYSYSMWHIPKFNNIEYHGGEYLLEIANDGADIGSSTSINANQLYNQSGKGLLKLYAVAYSTFTNVFGDINTGMPFLFSSCQGITLDSPEIEIISNGKFAWVINSSVTFNSPAVHVLKGAMNEAGSAFLWNIESNSNVVINAARFPNYSEGVTQHNVRFNVDYASHVTLNQCKLPTNMSPYRGLSGGSTLTTIDENGVTVQTAEGTGTKFDGRRIVHGDGWPTSGKWNIGDIILLNVVSAGNPIGYYCVRSGEYGVTEQTPSFSFLPTLPPDARQERFADQKPSSGYWRKGDIVINTKPDYDGAFAWVCVKEGFAPTEADFNDLRLTSVTESSDLPGEASLQKGDENAGLYGFVPPQEFGLIEGNPEGQQEMTASNLALACGLAAGTPINENTTWVKFSSMGEVIFVPVKPLRHTVSYIDLYKAGIVYGDGTDGRVVPVDRSGVSVGATKQDKVVTIGGHRYAVRLLRGAASDPLDSYNDADRGLVGEMSEWNNLILPLHEKARLQDWAYPAYAGTTEDWGTSLSDEDLVTHTSAGQGSYTWCIEQSDGTATARVFRGERGASYGLPSDAWNAYANFAWRPALVLIS